MIVAQIVSIHSANLAIVKNVKEKNVKIVVNQKKRNAKRKKKVVRKEINVKNIKMMIHNTIKKIYNAKRMAKI
jgi:hypothetical protein